MNFEEYKKKLEERILKEIKSQHNSQRIIAFTDCLIWISEIYNEMLTKYLEESYEEWE